LLQDSNAAAGTTVNSEINLAQRQRFKILRDMQIDLPSCTNAAGVITNLGLQDNSTKTYSIDMFIKMKGLEAVYNATNGGTILDITSGSVYLMTLIGSAGNNNGWNLAFGSRLRYYD